MLYALGDPLSFVVLVLAFLVCVTLLGWVSAALSARRGAVAVRQQGRTRPDPRRHVDPFGAVSAAIAGIGWAAPVELPWRRSRGTAVAVLLTGPLLLLALGLAGLAAFGVVHQPVGGASATLLQQGIALDDVAQRVWLLGAFMATYVGALSLVPLPPLPGGHLLFALAPRSPGWQQAEHQLVERNIGTAVLLALVLIPLGSATAVLPAVLDAVLSPLVRVVAGGS